MSVVKAASRAAAAIVFMVAVVLLGVLPLVPGRALAESGGATGRISVATGGAQATGGATSSFPSVSADGRFVAFSSTATGLVAGDTNAAIDVFLRDRREETTVRVSVGPGGVQGNNPSSAPVISADGRFVAYTSTASNLVAGDTATADVFVYDRVAAATTKVSVSSTGVAGNGASLGPALSADGRNVAFTSGASNLVTGDTNGFGDVFVHDRLTATTSRVNLGPGGVQTTGPVLGSGAVSNNASISADGRFVSFASAAVNLVAGDTNNTSDIFLRDRATSITTRISVGPGGVQANGTSAVTSISADGRWVAYASTAANLVAGDTNGSSDVFVYERDAGVTTRVSLTAAGGQASGGGSFLPSISGDGRFVAFDSSAADLVADDTNGVSDIFVRDRQAATTDRVSVGAGGAQSNGGSFVADLSDDGRFVTFSSEGTNLVAGDTNGIPDVFLRDRLGSSSYWLAAADGGIFAFGDAGFFGSAGDLRLSKPVVAMAATPSRRGYWLSGSDGGIFNYGNAGFFGSSGDLRLNQPVVAMAATPTGNGYWLVAADGGIFNYGDAAFLGSAGDQRLNQPVVAMAATPTGNGYWLVAADGGIFNYGDAAFLGSAGGLRLNRPIVGAAATPSGGGYWLVASDGGIFNYGDAGFFGSSGDLRLNKPIVAMAGTASGAGYRLAASDGGIFSYGDAGFSGSTGDLRLNQPMVALATA